jgi:hypothetical protein
MVFCGCLARQSSHSHSTDVIAADSARSLFAIIIIDSAIPGADGSLLGVGLSAPHWVFLEKLFKKFSFIDVVLAKGKNSLAPYATLAS